MKRIFALIAVISAFLGTMAQRPLVTLSHDGNLSFFSTLSAFEDAVKAAVDGDKLYLSEGNFTSASDTVLIDKRISVIGCGYKSHIHAELRMRMPNPSEQTDLTLFDGVRLQNVGFYGVQPDNLNATISKSWIQNLRWPGDAGKNLLIDRCFIERSDFYGCDKNNTTVQNSKIVNAGYDSNGSGCESTAAIQVINCNIFDMYFCPRVMINSILYRSKGGTGGSVAYQLERVEGYSPVVYNSLVNSTTFLDNVKTYNCYEDVEIRFDESLLETAINLQEKGYLGEDGTVVGVYGGEFPYSANPNVPTVDSANSSVEYDAENNKLNVTITVSPN